MRALLLKMMVVAGLLALGTFQIPVRDAAGAGDITDLGKPTGDVVQMYHQPLSYFRRTGPFLRKGRKPELLFMSTMADEQSALERWPLVKALRQFGRFSGVAPIYGMTCAAATRTQPEMCDKAGRMWEGMPTGTPTYNLDHARYTSRYLQFVNVDVLNYHLQAASHLSPLEVGLLKKYVVYKRSAKGWIDVVANGANAPQNDMREFPLLSIGGYLETRYAAVTFYDLGAATGAPPNYLGPGHMFFDAIQQSLLHHHLTNMAHRWSDGTPMGRPPASLLTDVNAEANVITALICHADNKRPGKVCNRPVIKAILKHVK